MVKILIVDDDNQRIREISAEISRDNVIIENATTKNDAKRMMGATQYDLVLLDIMLPDDATTVTLTRDAGVDLLTQIENVRSIKKPLSIVGLTSGSDVYTTVKPFFDSKLIPLLSWTSTSTDWKEQIKNKIDYLLKMDRQKKHIPKADIAIITAVEIEYEAARSMFKDWGTVTLEDDPSIYQYTKALINGKEKSVVLTMLPEMGMIAASCLTTKIIQTFNPDQVYMLGICGGIKGEVELDDIIVASKSWDYGSGKIKPPRRESAYYELEPAPNPIAISASIDSEIRAYKDEIVTEIKNEWRSQSQGKEISPTVHLAPMPSGAAVICDEQVFSNIIRPQNRKCVGLDMETYGVYFAVKNSSRKQIDFLSVKCVSDFADIEKNDDHHSSCCFISSRFVFKFIEKHNQ